MDKKRRGWPAWVEPLRPDAVARGRLRAAIRRRAEPIFEAHRLGSWEDVAAGWARMLMPIAAVLVLFFAGLAHQATPRTVATPALTLEELTQEEDPEGTLAVLTTSVEPSPDWALTAPIRRENENR